MTKERSSKSQLAVADPVIRLATSGDLESVQALSLTALRDWGIEPTQHSCSQAIALYRKQIDLKLMLVAEISDGVIGFCAWISHEISKSIAPDRVHITNTVVHPDFRRRGMAEALKRELMLLCTKRQVRMITTNHDPENKSIIELSKKLGFISYQENELNEQCGQHIFMRLILKP